MRSIKQVACRYPGETAILLALILLATLNNTVGFLSGIEHFDGLMHLLIPAFGAPLAYLALSRAGFVPADPSADERHSARKFITMVVLVGVATEALWEILEFSLDQAFGLTTQPGNFDTMLDIISAVIGSFAGAGVFRLRQKQKNQRRSGEPDMLG